MRKPVVGTMTALFVTAASLVGFSTLVAAPAQARDLNCSDFSSQAAAQQNLNANPSDPNGLDADGNGVACESNPCPCTTNQSSGGGSGTSTPPEKQSKPTKPAQPRVLRVVKVIDGELVRVRLGNDRPYVIHQLGIAVPSSVCETRAAKQDLKKVLKPGRNVVAIAPGKAPDKDKNGNVLRFLGKSSGGKVVSVGLTQIAKGYADADRTISYPFKGKYKRIDKAATAQALGYHGACA